MSIWVLLRVKHLVKIETENLSLGHGARPDNIQLLGLKDLMPSSSGIGALGWRDTLFLGKNPTLGTNVAIPDSKC